MLNMRRKPIQRHEECMDTHISTPTAKRPLHSPAVIITKKVIIIHAEHQVNHHQFVAPSKTRYPGLLCCTTVDHKVRLNLLLHVWLCICALLNKYTWILPNGSGLCGGKSQSNKSELAWTKPGAVWCKGHTKDKPLTLNNSRSQRQLLAF